ncbi:hypothetical protein FG379_001519 [Cryptosporidium bovis]|uniref:uncharacterized protein n=1 Tax=Cryptosporidium bovis TaxID=310047 RepID=UPI00351A024E|nr:hypothetical protein FG379_001519 [Cryptosporidium bovis]
MILKYYVLVILIKYSVSYNNNNYLSQNVLDFFKTVITGKHNLLNSSVHGMSLSQLKMDKSSSFYLIEEGDNLEKIKSQADVRMDSFLFSKGDILAILELFDDTLLEKTLNENLYEAMDELIMLLKTQVNELEEIENECSGNYDKELQSNIEVSNQLKEKINKHLDFLFRILKITIQRRVTCFRNASREILNQKKYFLIDFYHRGLHFQKEIMDYLRNIFYILHCKTNHFVSNHPLCAYLTNSYLRFLQNHQSIQNYLLKLEKYPKYKKSVLEKHLTHFMDVYAANECEYNDLSTDSDDESVNSRPGKEPANPGRAKKKKKSRKRIISTKIVKTKTKVKKTRRSTKAKKTRTKNHLESDST